MKKNQWVRFTNTANTCLVSNNSHIILLGSSFRLLTKRIKNTPWAFCHFLSCKVGKWTPTIPNSCSDGTQNPSETKSKTPDTLENISAPRTAPWAEIDGHRNIACLCWSALICVSCTTGSRDKMTMCPWSASPDPGSLLIDLELNLSSSPCTAVVRMRACCLMQHSLLNSGLNFLDTFFVKYNVVLKEFQKHFHRLNNK